MSSNLSIEQLPLAPRAKDSLLINNSAINGASGKDDEHNNSFPAATPALGRSLSQSSLDSQTSSILSTEGSLGSSNSSLATTPNVTPKEDDKSGKTSYFPDYAAVSNLSTRNNILCSNSAPSYRVSSIPCPAPPLVNRPRPLTKKETKTELAFHTRINRIYNSAVAYEQHIVSDPMSTPSYDAQLGIWKKELWEYHMRENFPCPLDKASDLLDLQPECEYTVLMHGAIALYGVFLALLIRFILKQLLGGLSPF